MISTTLFQIEKEQLVNAASFKCQRNSCHRQFTPTDVIIKISYRNEEELYADLYHYGCIVRLLNTLLGSYFPVTF